jgi:hypothetical protein
MRFFLEKETVWISVKYVMQSDPKLSGLTREFSQPRITNNGLMNMNSVHDWFVGRLMYDPWNKASW